MKKKYIRVLSGVLILTMVNVSILPQMVAAQELEPQTPEVAIEEPTEAPQDRVPKTNNNMTVGKKEIAQSLKSLSGTVEDSNDVKVARDKDSAMIVESEGMDIDVPKDLEDGVELDFGDGLELEIELPNADNAKKAKKVANGIVAYPGKDGSANAVQADEDGGVKMLTIIDNENAPTEYEYKIDLPEGAYIEILEDGSADILNSAGDLIAIIDTPWAKDANENSVETWFTTDGQTLTQHVMHNVEGVAYPVVADPWWKRATNMLLGCIGGKDAVNQGIKYFRSKGYKFVFKRAFSRYIPYYGWATCIIGASAAW